jgi:hypothetical protein
MAGTSKRVPPGYQPVRHPSFETALSRPLGPLMVRSAATPRVSNHRLHPPQRARNPREPPAWRTGRC